MIMQYNLVKIIYPPLAEPVPTKVGRKRFSKNVFSNGGGL